MTNIEQQFFKVFGIEPKHTYVRNYPIIEERIELIKYPKITSNKLLELEEIFSSGTFFDTMKNGFYDGFHVHKYYYPYNTSKNQIQWEYQLTYRKGGYYKRGKGNTRKNALLNQFIIIMQDKDIDNEEKDIIKQQVQSLFREEKNECGK